MANIGLKILIWAKIVLLSLVALYCLFFFCFNSDTVNVWVFFKHTYPVTVALLILFTMIATAILLVLLKIGWGTIRQMRDLKQPKQTPSSDNPPAAPDAKANPPETPPASLISGVPGSGDKKSA